jgi:hypothetical protein
VCFFNGDKIKDNVKHMCLSVSLYTTVCGRKTWFSFGIVAFCLVGPTENIGSRVGVTLDAGLDW